MCCDEVVVAGGPLPLSARQGCSHLELTPDPRSPAAARRFVHATVGDDLDEDSATTLALLTSELVTNGVLHARTALQVGVTEHDGEILVAVGDHNLLQPEQQPYSDTRTDGRGMTLLKALAHRWGVTTYDGGKSVWFTVLRHGLNAVAGRDHGGQAGRGHQREEQEQ